MILDDALVDMDDLLRDINNLDTNKLLKVSESCPSRIYHSHTKEILFERMISSFLEGYKPKYDYLKEDFVSQPMIDKLKINNINSGIETQIKMSLGLFLSY
ncbi:MAG: hypothetical protein R2865_04175 [Deinococcales bacterium]